MIAVESPTKKEANIDMNTLFNLINDLKKNQVI